MYEEIPFAGLAALAADERIPMNAALDASDCFIDDGALRGRNGYRSALASVAAVGTGTVQGMARLRTSSSFARLLVLQGGNVYAVTDPSSETATDGSVQTGIAAFGSTANISAAQLGKYCYLGSDDPTVAWRRARQSGSVVALDTFTNLPKGTQPTSSVTAPTVLAYSGLAAPTLSASVTSSTVGGDVLQIARTAAHCIAGDTAEWNFGANKDWTSYNYLQIFASPPSGSNGGGHLKISLATAAGAYEDIGEIYDPPGGGSSSVAWLPLNTLTSATRSAVRRIKFTMTSGDGIFLVYGHLAIPTASSVGQPQYFFTFYNSTSKQESNPTDTQTVSVGSIDLTGTKFHNVYRNYDGNNDAGLLSVDPAAIPNDRNFNHQAGQAFPSTNDYSGIISFSGSIPTGDQYPNADTVRGWRLTPTGYRLFATQTYTTGATTFSLSDTGGEGVNAALLYKAGGPPPACTAMAARGGRIAAGGAPNTPNRMFISSYVPINTELEGTTSDPFPQFPAIPVEDSDGYSFDISPTAAESVLSVVNGDALYILTNEAAYSMYDLELQGLQQPAPYKVFERGVVGRRAAIWAEERLFYAAHDGIYFCRNRSSVEELSEPIRRLFLSWFQPDSSVVLGYQDRKLYAVRGQRMLRFDFVTKSWTRHNLSHSMAQAAFWKTDSDAKQRLQFLDTAGKLLRWQPGISPSDTNRATSDAGTAIPAWTYSSGFDLKTGFKPGEGYGETKSRIKFLFCDSDGAVTVSCVKDMNALTAGTNGPQSVSFTAGEHGKEVAPMPTGFKWRVLLTAANGVSVRRLMMDRQTTTGQGG